ncbi:MAG: hypothetical protein ACXWQ5_11240 [Ktedonobacterales bacterium]
MSVRGSTRRAKPAIWPVPGRAHPSQPNIQAPAAGSRLGCAARVLLALIVLSVVALGVAFWRLGATVTNYPGAHFNLGRNAVWLEHTWAGQQHTDVEYDQLAARLEREQIGYVFAHVGPLDSDGTIPGDRAPNAAGLAAALHARLPHVRVLAWIGQVEVAGGYPADQSVNLDDSAVRLQIAQTAARIAADDGFDGVHYDIEPIVNNNPRFLDLLQETQARLPNGAMLSVVGQKWAPNAHVADLLRGVGRGDAWWTSYYYAAVAAHVDQIVPMLYNTAMPTQGSYELAMQQEAQHILEATRSARQPPEVLIGLPTYPGNGFWFHATAENMTSGLHGVIAGLNSNRDTSAFAGVAIYRFGTSSDADWREYEQLWLGK